MIRHTAYARERFAQVAAELRAGVHPEAVAPDELLVAGPVGRVSYDEAMRLDFRPATLGERLAPLWATYWFRLAATVPDAWAGRRVDLIWASRAESTLWLAGKSVQGLHGVEPRQRPDATLLSPARGGERVEAAIELACNGLFGRLDAPPEVERCELALVDEEAWRTYLDFEVLRALEESEPGAAWGGLLRAELGRFCNERDPSLLTALYENHGGTREHEMLAIGHAHIDTAWLWPLAETHRKLVRTFGSQTRYMDEYPEYRFACSQAQQYAWIEEREPDLWQRIREKVAAGQFVPVGGSWVEPDCNLPSGESLLRQLVHGQRYFEERFGTRCREFWSPDAFGYCGQLPQLLRLAGITRFLTQKLSWNRFNRPDAHTFVWQGDDGSEVLGHFPPADNYNSDASVAEVLYAEREFKDHESSSTSLLVYGFGDGGGGPTREMLERIRRMRDLQGLPRVRTATSDEFFSALEGESAPRPTVVGELYFEYHRGVYTSQAFVKRGNRVCEQLLHDAEFLGTARGSYAREELDRLWKLLLLQQFHDILPGSSIGLVYEDARRDFAELEQALDGLVGAGDTPVNTIGVSRRELVDGRLVEAPPYGDGMVVEAADAVTVDGLTLENGQLRVELGADGTVLSVVEKATGRETLAAPGNRLELYEDRPVKFDAWDVDPSHLETRRDAPPADSFAVLASGPLRAEVEFRRQLGERSTLRQVVRLDAESRRLEFHTEVDWHEDHVLLKVCFPLAVRATTATYEMPFGYAERPTHFSTSFDRARYEVPGHRFADLSEHGFGAALLTDSKYGYSCFGSELRISLLRAPKSPDPDADMGKHAFSYALLPHAAGWREAGVLAEARRFNAPIRRTAGVGASFASVDDPNLVLDSVKRAERGDAMVLRLYEAHGARGTARVRLREHPRAVRFANALEEPQGALAIEDGEIVLPYLPHQVLTVVVEA